MIKKNSSLFLFLLFLYSIFCALQLGVTWDTFFYYELGKDRLDYLLTLGNDESFKKIPHGKYLPGAYSTISAFFIQFFPKAFIVEALYFFNLIFSFLTVVGIYKISKYLFNKEIGRITFLICFFNPIFFGHMAMNHNDTIVSFANIWFFYLLLKYFKKQNNGYKQNKYIFLSGICLGLGLGVRSSFLVTIFPILIFVAINSFFSKSLFIKNFSLKKFVLDTLKVFLIAYLFMVLFWPHTHSNIFVIPFQLALEGLSYGFGVPFIMLNGEFFLTNEFPKNYLFKNLFFKTPEFIILSYLIFLFLFKKISEQFNSLFGDFYNKIFLIFFVILFPNFLLLLSPYSPYDGVRFFLYLIPYISIIPAILFFFILKNLKSFFNKLIFSSLLFFTFFALFNFFYLTPYHYVYLNTFAGKTTYHSLKFENDYWGVSTKKLISKIEKNLAEFNNIPVKFATCGIEEKAQITYLKKVKSLNFKMVKNSDDYDFIIMNNRVPFDQEKDLTRIKTCFQKFQGVDIIKIKARDLVISKIVRKE